MTELREELARAATMLDLGRYEEASTLLARVVSVEPGSSRAWCLFARAHLGADRYVEAVEAANRAAAIEPAEEWPHRLASNALMHLGNHAEALRAASESRRLAPSYWQTHVCVAQAALAAAQPALAASAAAEARRLAPNEPDAMGLLALMLYAHARREARRDAKARYVPLSEQDTGAWDQAAIGEAEGLLRTAGARGAPGRFQLEAAVQSVHAARRLTGRTDWQAIVVLYDGLFVMTASPVVAVNRAVAVAHARGAAPALKLLDEVGAQGGLEGFEPYWVARADLCAKLGEVAEARRAYDLAIGLQTDPAARAFLIERLAALA